MEMQEVISRAERNIRQALRDYGAHTSQTDVLDDVTDEFIYRLAADSSYAKQGLRKLFSKSPVWNEELDALVINGTRTHDPDYDRIHRLAMQILEKPFKSLDYDYNDILKAICFSRTRTPASATGRVTSRPSGSWPRKPTRPRRSRAACSNRCVWRWA